MKLSYSQMQTWLSCKYKWSLNYKERLVPRVDRPRLDLGSAVHAGIAEALRRPDDPFGAASGVAEFVDEKKERNKLNDEELLALDDIGHEATILAENLLANIKEERYTTCIHPKLKQPLIECRLEVPLPIVGWEGFKGYLDWVAVEEETGFVWLVDFKVRSSFQSQEAEEYNVQMAIYQHLLRAEGIDVRGGISWQVKNTAPKTPKVNKSGKDMSRAKIATTWEHYKAALVTAGFDPADYEEEMKPKLAEIEWFRQSRAYRSSKEVDNVWNLIVLNAATQMMRPQPMVRSLSFMNCNGCSYKDLCLEGLRGGDVEFIKRTQYRSLDEKQIEDPEQVPPPEEWQPPEITE